MSRYLFIGAHPDDCELSCGGTMAKLSEKHNVHHIAFSDCGLVVLYGEMMDSSTMLNISFECHNYKRGFDRQKIADHLYQIRDDYDFVFTHSTECRHSDHRIIAEESKRIFNCNLITYMQPWNGAHPENYFIELTGDQLEKKINALYCYRSQSHRSYMSSEFIHAQAVYNGIKCGKKYAEAFKIERLIQ